jgi:hypothetical protein
MPEVGFEHTTQVFERKKIFHALNRGATVIGEVLAMDFRNRFPAPSAFLQLILLLHKNLSYSLSYLCQYYEDS